MSQETLWIILGMAGVTFATRFLPMALLSKWSIPERGRLGLEYVPVAILSAIVFPILFFDQTGNFDVQPRYLLSALSSFGFAWKVKSVWGSVLVGMLSYWMLGFML